jgi:hypothetical protein
MSKVTFSKLQLKTEDIADKELVINDQKILVKQYLPMADKLSLIEEILTSSIDEQYGYFNPIKLDLISTLLIIKTYTNISFTDVQLTKNIFKTIETLDLTGTTDKILELIPREEYSELIKCISECSKAIERFNCSVSGMVARVNVDRDNLKFDIQQLTEGLSDENIGLVKDILTKL